MISFILNDQFIQTDKPAGMTLLDFIRYEMDLKGTKIGCREGDCGACNVLEGSISGDMVQYATTVSCLTPLGNAHGKHIVTVEGINMDDLSPVQKMLVEHNGTQCGFCTPGFVISLTSFLLSESSNSSTDAIAAMDGNICRCTGYKSIEKAAEELARMKSGIGNSKPVEWMIQYKYLPAYFSDIPEILSEIALQPKPYPAGETIIGGGTDLMVQRPDEMLETKLDMVFDEKQLKGINVKEGYCVMGAEATATDIMESPALLNYFPKLKEHFKLISSTPIRNMGTIAGNVVNASPIGDLSIFMLALDAKLLLNKNGILRTVDLKDFFLGYKSLNLAEGEIIENVVFKLPDESTYFNFEKVSKRQHLDIASVNSSVSLKMKDEEILEAHLSAGGVSPVPLYLKETSAFLIGRSISLRTIVQANTIAQKEISPISDIRGSKQYKRLLLRQLIIAHFMELFPEKMNAHEILAKIIS